VKEQPAPVKEQPKQVKEQPAPVKEQPKQQAEPLPPIISEEDIKKKFQLDMEIVKEKVQPKAPPAPVKPDNIFPGLTEKEEVVENQVQPIAPPPMPEITVTPSPKEGGTKQMNPYMPKYPMMPHHGGGM